MIFTELELAIEEGDFLSRNDDQKYYLIHDGKVYHLVTFEQRKSLGLEDLPILEIFRPYYTYI